MNRIQDGVPELPRNRIGSDIWLARIFMLALLAVGLAVHVFGASPDDLMLCPCPFYSVTDVKCPGCGMTHACIAIVSGDFRGAWMYHPFSFGLILFAGGIALIPHRVRRFWNRFPRSARGAIGFSLLALILGFWVNRLLL
jgi:hypothetical protein